MKKKLIISIGAVVLFIGLGVGIYQSDAANTNPELTFNDIEQIVMAQYPGTITDIELDKEQGTTIYEVDVKSDDKKYELKIDANSGEVLKLEEKQIQHNEETNSEGSNKQAEVKDKDAPKKKVAEDNNRDSFIDMIEAIEIALQEFPGTVTEAELDKDDGRLIYEIEIKSNGEEADIDIDAYTGEVIVIEIDD